MALLDQGSGSVLPPPLPTPDAVAAAQAAYQSGAAINPASGGLYGIPVVGGLLQQTLAPAVQLTQNRVQDIASNFGGGPAAFSTPQDIAAANALFALTKAGSGGLSDIHVPGQALAGAEAAAGAAGREITSQALRVPPVETGGFLRGEVGAAHLPGGSPSELEQQLAASIAARKAKVPDVHPDAAAMGVTVESQAVAALRSIPEEVLSQIRKLARGEPSTITDKSLNSTVEDALNENHIALTPRNRQALLKAIADETAARNAGGAELNSLRNQAKKAVTTPAAIPGQGSPRGPLAQRIASQAAATTPGAATNEALATARGQAFQPGTGGALKPNTIDASVSAAAQGEHAAALPEGAVPPTPPAPPSAGGPWAAFLDAWNLPKALKASWDLSAPGRQGILTAAAHPSEFFGNFGPMVHAFTSEKFAHAVDTEIRAGPKSQIVQEGLAKLGFVDKTTGLPARSPRLYLAEHQGLSGREEAFMTRLAGKIPLVKNSEQAYITYLNKLRADIYDNTLESWFRKGKDVKPSDVDGLADVVNHFTGRGDLAFGSKMTPVLNGAFFSPRFTISRVQSVGDALGLLKSRDSLAAKEAANMLVKSVTAGVAMLALAKAGGASVETDPRSSNFGKIKVGDTTYDIWGGQQQLARYVGQFLTGQTKVLTGPNAGNVQTATRGDTLGRFITSKLAPTAGVVWDIINYKSSPKDAPGTIGRNFIGTPFTLSDLVNPTKSTNLITPLFGSDIADAVAAATGEGQSPVAGAVKGLPSGFGIGVNTIVQTPEQKNAQALADKWYAAPAFSIGNPTEWAAVYRALNQYKTLTAGKTVAQIRADPKLVAFYNSAAGGRLKVYASDSGAIRSALVSPQRQAIQKDPNFKNLGITIQSILSHLGQ